MSQPANANATTIVRGTTSCDPIRRTRWGTIVFAEESSSGGLYEIINPASRLCLRDGADQDVMTDGAVLFFDVHQHPWYPGTGSPNENGDGKGRGLIVNNPFPAGSGRTEIGGVFRDALVPAADRFKPQLVMISAGFDSRAGDPLGRFTLTDQVIGIARQHAGGRIVSVLEGGYSLEGLPRAVASHLTRLGLAS